MAELKITFPVSRAIMYPAIMRLAKQFGDAFKPADDQSKVNTIVIDSKSINDPLLKKIRKLWALAKPIKHAAFTIDGEKPFLFEGSVGRILSCMKARDYAEDAEAYCNGSEGKRSDTFGCRHLKSVSSHPKIPSTVLAMRDIYRTDDDVFDPNSKIWDSHFIPMPFSLYAEKTDKGWVFDKKKLKAKVRSKLKGMVCQACPHFSWDRVEKTIDARCVAASVTFSTMTEREIYGIDRDPDDDDDGFSDT